MDVTEILKCPKTGNRLRFNHTDSVVVVEDCPVTYPIINGIVDFCPGDEDAVSESYDQYSAHYDAYMTSSSLSIKLFNLLFWGSVDDFESLKQVFCSYLPPEFDGILLDVPVGTGVFTDSLYGRYPDATIIAVDYSMGMLQEARKRFEKQGFKHVCLIRADVGNLPIIDGTVDIILSMNGLHAFPNKRSAITEMGRVTRSEGSLIGSCYTKGDSWRCDWFVKLWGIPKGCFSPPLLTRDDIGSYLDGFEIKRQVNIKTGIYFEAVRK